MKIRTLSVLFAIALLPHSNVFAKETGTIIDKGKKVRLNYTMKADGHVVDSTQGKEPLEFVYGSQPIMPGLAKGLKGLKVGDHKQLSIPAAEGFGPVNPSAVLEVPKANFPNQEIKPGMVFTTSGKDGRPLRGTVKELHGEKILMDFNHPLAGKALEIDIDILEIT